jgi:hypothetical protein
VPDRDFGVCVGKGTYFETRGTRISLSAGNVCASA